MHEKLKALEATGDYVFHGSANDKIIELEPRQAFSYGKPDGKPAVFAAGYADPAIFMAVLGSRKAGGWDRDGNKFKFYIEREPWEQAKKENWAGHVYVLNRESFKRYRSWDWRSETAVTPVEVVEVSFTDLPYGIKVLTAEEEAQLRKQYDQD